MKHIKIADEHPRSLGPSSTLPVQSSTNCTLPSTAQPYSLKYIMTTPAGPRWLTAWPTPDSASGLDPERARQDHPC
jgi:hypothetical protein